MPFVNVTRACATESSPRSSSSTAPMTAAGSGRDDVRQRRLSVSIGHHVEADSGDGARAEHVATPAAGALDIGKRAGSGFDPLATVVRPDDHLCGAVSVDERDLLWPVGGRGQRIGTAPRSPRRAHRRGRSRRRSSVALPNNGSVTLDVAVTGAGVARAAAASGGVVGSTGSAVSPAKAIELGSAVATSSAGDHHASWASIRRFIMCPPRGFRQRCVCRRLRIPTRCARTHTEVLRK